MKVERNVSKGPLDGRGGSDSSRRIDFFNPEEYISSKVCLPAWLSILLSEKGDAVNTKIRS